MSDMSLYDKNGKKIFVGDIVKLDIFEPKLRHTGPQAVLGIVTRFDLSYDNTFLLISLGLDEFRERRRRPDEVTVVKVAYYEFEHQWDDLDQILMLWKLENAL